VTNADVLTYISENWEEQLANGLSHANSCDLDNDRIALAAAVPFAIMRGMQDTIDELRSRLAYLEGRQ
jgi:hypothetical protein